MYVKLRISKALPRKAEEYAMSKNILDSEIKRNLFSSSLSPAAEMIRTAHHFGKWKNENERKTFSLIFSPNPKDNPAETQLAEIIEASMDRFFPNHQCVIVLHRDKTGTSDQRKLTPVLHGHVYGSIIDPVSGKNMHVSQGELNEMRKWIDAYAIEKYGWTPLFRTRDKSAHSRFRNNALRAMKAKGQYSWKNDMLSRIEQQYDAANSYEDFLKRLKEEGIGVVSKRVNTRTKEEYSFSELMFSFDYKGKTMMVRGSNLSPKLSPAELNNHFKNIGGTDNVRLERRYTYTQPTNTKKLDTGFSSGQCQAGTDSGQGHQRINVGKIDFHCIDCTHKKDICEQCSRYDRWQQGGHGYERNARTR